MKIRTALFIFSICTLSLVSCCKNKSVETNSETVTNSKQVIFDEKPDVVDKQTKEESKKEAKEEPRETTESVGNYDVKMKSGTKTLKGSVDISRESDSLLHIDIKPDAEASLFRPDLFGPEKLMVVQVLNPGSVYEYMIIPLDSQKAKVDRVFKCFNQPPEIVIGPKNGEFTAVFLEPFPDSGARPIAPCVAVKYKKGKLILDAKIMKERGKEAELGDIQSVKEAFEMNEDPNDVPAELADEVINRYYLGQAKDARKFFDKAWPKKHKGKADAWKNIVDQMEQSPYWPQIKKMNQSK